MEDLVGKRIGRYEVVRLIGRGGMSYVYLAYDTTLKRDVAFKIVRKDVFSETEFETIRQRFLAECQNLAQLNHPNIVKIFDVGEYESSPYLIMEFLDGNTLRILTGAQMSAPTAASLLLPIADALAYMHSKGLIHRDVKPSNIILKADGTPVLTDFGISRSIEKDPNKPALTQAGYMIGTPDYISPEQALGGKLDGRSDEYSLAVILYEMVTGAKLYQGDTPNEIANKQINAPIPSAKSINPNLTDYEEAILKKALSKNPNDRYPTMKEFEFALQSIVDRENIVSKTVLADEEIFVTFPTRESVAAASPQIPAPDSVRVEKLLDSPKNPEVTEKPGINKAIIILLLAALAIICVLGMRMIIGQNQSSLLPTASIESQAVEIVSAAASTSEINNVQSEEKPSPTDNSTNITNSRSLNGQNQEQIVLGGTSNNNEETPEEKYGLWFTDYEVKNVVDSNGIAIREKADSNAGVIGGSFSVARNGEVLVGTGKTDSDWIGVRTADGYEGYLPSENLDLKTKGIAISISEFEYEVTGNKVTIKKYKGIQSRIMIPAVFEGKQVESIGVQSFYKNNNIRAVVIPEGVTSIESSAFGFCESLEYVSLPESLETIGSFGFNFTNLLSIDLPKNLKKIGYDAFSYNKNLTSVIIPEGIEEIDSSVFYECISLSSVTLPDSVISIGINSFMDTGLTEIVLPKNLKTIGYRAFKNSKLTNVTFPEDLSSIDGEAFLGNQLESVTLSKYTKYEQNSFDDNVEIIKVN